MKKRTFQEFITLGKKRYILRAVVLLLIAVSGIGAAISILSQRIILNNHDYFVNIFVEIIWLAIAIISLARLSYNRDLFLQGKLDWVFGDNISDDPIPKKFYCKNENCNNEISKNRYYSIFTDSLCDDCNDQSD